MSQPKPAAALLREVPITDDVVDYTLACVLALAPELRREIASQVDRQVRDLFGRSSAYIATRAGDGQDARNAAIRRDHAAGERIPLLCRRYQLSRSQVHRILAIRE